MVYDLVNIEVTCHAVTNTLIEGRISGIGEANPCRALQIQHIGLWNNNKQVPKGKLILLHNFLAFFSPKRTKHKGNQKFCFGTVTATCKKCSPLFQLYSFLTSALPLGLNGPFSEKAPTPTDEQPGPTFTCMGINIISLQKNLHWQQNRKQQREGTRRSS